MQVPKCFGLIQIFCARPNIELRLVPLQKIYVPFKGHLISKWFFGVVDFLQKTNENKSLSSKNEFIRSFFGGSR